MKARPPEGPLGEAPRLPDGTVAPLSPAFVGGDFIFLSGQLAFDPRGQIDGSDIRTQTRRCLTNIEQLLHSADAERGDVVKVTVWLVDAADFAGFNEVYADFFAEHRPARSTVCAELLVPGARVEIEAVARLSHPG